MSDAKEEVMTPHEAWNIMMTKLKIDYTGLTEEDIKRVEKAVYFSMAMLESERYWEQVIKAANDYFEKRVPADYALQRIVCSYSDMKMFRTKQIEEFD